MSRPRIRTLKPENWADEAVGRVSRDARLLRDVLITFADDDGRWRHLPAAIIGHGYPYDEDVSAKLVRRWVDELVAEGIVIIYEHDAVAYGCFPKWHLHQQINKYSPSALPACTDQRVVSKEEASRIKRAGVPSSDGSPTGEPPETDRPTTPGRPEGGRPRAQARGSVPRSKIPSPDPVPGDDARERGEDRPDVTALCERLADAIRRNDEKAKPASDSKGWRDAARLLLTADQRPAAEVAAVIDWCQLDSFWRCNVLSMPTLRRQYPKLLLKMQSARPSTPAGGDWIADMRAAAGAEEAKAA